MPTTVFMRRCGKCRETFRLISFFGELNLLILLDTRRERNVRWECINLTHNVIMSSLHDGWLPSRVCLIWRTVTSRLRERKKQKKIYYKFRGAFLFGKFLHHQHPFVCNKTVFGVCGSGLESLWVINSLPLCFGGIFILCLLVPPIF